MHKANKFKVGLVQMGMSSDPSANLDKAVKKVGEAAAKGAQVICLPELYRSPYFCQKEEHVQFDLAEGRFSAQAASLYARPDDSADLAAKLVELIDDPVRRAAMGEYGRRRVENELEWRHEGPRLLSAYDSLWSGSTSERQAPERPGLPSLRL